MDQALRDATAARGGAAQSSEEWTRDTKIFIEKTLLIAKEISKGSAPSDHELLVWFVGETLTGVAAVAAERPEEDEDVVSEVIGAGLAVCGALLSQGLATEGASMLARMLLGEGPPLEEFYKHRGFPVKDSLLGVSFTRWADDALAADLRGSVCVGRKFVVKKPVPREGVIRAYDPLKKKFGVSYAAATQQDAAAPAPASASDAGPVEWVDLEFAQLVDTYSASFVDAPVALASSSAPVVPVLTEGTTIKVMLPGSTRWTLARVVETDTVVVTEEGERVVFPPGRLARERLKVQAPAKSALPPASANPASNSAQNGARSSAAANSNSKKSSLSEGDAFLQRVAKTVMDAYAASEGPKEGEVLYTRRPSSRLTKDSRFCWSSVEQFARVGGFEAAIGVIDLANSMDNSTCALALLERGCARFSVEKATMLAELTRQRLLHPLSDASLRTIDVQDMDEALRRAAEVVRALSRETLNLESFRWDTLLRVTQNSTLAQRLLGVNTLASQTSPTAHPGDAARLAAFETWLTSNGAIEKLLTVNAHAEVSRRALPLTSFLARRAALDKPQLTAMWTASKDEDAMTAVHSTLIQTVPSLSVPLISWFIETHVTTLPFQEYDDAGERARFVCDLGQALIDYSNRAQQALSTTSSKTALAQSYTDLLNVVINILWRFVMDTSWGPSLSATKLGLDLLIVLLSRCSSKRKLAAIDELIQNVAKEIAAPQSLILIEGLTRTFPATSADADFYDVPAATAGASGSSFYSSSPQASTNLMDDGANRSKSIFSSFTASKPQTRRAVIQGLETRHRLLKLVATGLLERYLPAARQKASNIQHTTLSSVDSLSGVSDALDRVRVDGSCFEHCDQIRIRLDFLSFLLTCSNLKLPLSTVEALWTELVTTTSSRNARDVALGWFGRNHSPIVMSQGATPLSPVFYPFGSTAGSIRFATPIQLKRAALSRAALSDDAQVWILTKGLPACQIAGFGVTAVDLAVDYFLAVNRKQKMVKASSPIDQDFAWQKAQRARGASATIEDEQVDDADARRNRALESVERIGDNIVGLELIWRIALETVNDEAASMAVELLARLQVAYAGKSEAKSGELRKNFCTACLEKAQRVSASPMERLRAALLLKAFLILVSDRGHGPNESVQLLVLPPLAGSPGALSRRDEMPRTKTKPISLLISTSTTLGELRRLIASALDFDGEPSELVLRLATNNGSSVLGANVASSRSGAANGHHHALHHASAMGGSTSSVQTSTNPLLMIPGDPVSGAGQILLREGDSVSGRVLRAGDVSGRGLGSFSNGHATTNGVPQWDEESTTLKDLGVVDRKTIQVFFADATARKVGINRRARTPGSLVRTTSGAGSLPDETEHDGEEMSEDEEDQQDGGDNVSVASSMIATVRNMKPQDDPDAESFEMLQDLDSEVGVSIDTAPSSWPGSPLDSEAAWVEDWYHGTVEVNDANRALLAFVDPVLTALDANGTKLGPAVTETLWECIHLLPTQPLVAEALMTVVSMPATSLSVSSALTTAASASANHHSGASATTSPSTSDSSAAGSHTDWAKLLPVGAAYRALYVLRVADALRRRGKLTEDDAPTAGSMAEGEAWSKRFSQSAGAAHLALMVRNFRIWEGPRRASVLAALYSAAHCLVLSSLSSDKDRILLAQAVIEALSETKLEESTPCLVARGLELAVAALPKNFAVPDPTGTWTQASSDLTKLFTTYLVETSLSPTVLNTSITIASVALKNAMAIGLYRIALVSPALGRTLFASFSSTLSGFIAASKSVGRDFNPNTTDGVRRRRRASRLCESYFTFGSKLATALMEHVGESAEAGKLATSVFESTSVALVAHASTESLNSRADHLQIGFMRLLRGLLSAPALRASLRALPKCQQLTSHLVDFALFPGDGTQTCTTSLSRNAAIGLLQELCLSPENADDSYVRNLLDVLSQNKAIRSLSKLHANRWGYDPQRAARHPMQYAGLHNLGTTCYMNSVLQQLFHVPSFAQAISEIDIAAFAAKQAQEQQAKAAQMAQKGGVPPRPPIDQGPKESSLRPLQVLFAQMSVPEAREPSVDTRPFAKTLREPDGERIDLGEQKDPHEFCDLLFTRLEEEGAKRALLDHFGGVFTQQTLSTDPNRPYISEKSEPFYFLSVEIKGKSNLVEALDATMQGQRLVGDNKCELPSGEKVDGLVRHLIRDLPPHLMIHLKRFELKYETMSFKKVDDYLSFPMVLDMEPYTIDYSRRNPLDVATAMRAKESRSGAATTPLLSSSSTDDGESSDAHRRSKSYYRYELSGVLVHAGEMDSGHYYSFIRERLPRDGELGRQWYEFNDYLVWPYSADRIPFDCFGGAERLSNGQVAPRAHSAYILVYDRVERAPTNALGYSGNFAGSGRGLTPSVSSPMNPSHLSLSHPGSEGVVSRQGSFHSSPPGVPPLAQSSSARSRRLVDLSLSTRLSGRELGLEEAGASPKMLMRAGSGGRGGTGMLGSSKAMAVRRSMTHLGQAAQFPSSTNTNLAGTAHPDMTIDEEYSSDEEDAPAKRRPSLRSGSEGGPTPRGSKLRVSFAEEKEGSSAVAKSAPTHLSFGMISSQGAMAGSFVTKVPGLAKQVSAATAEQALDDALFSSTFARFVRDVLRSSRRSGDESLELSAFVVATRYLCEVLAHATLPSRLRVMDLWIEELVKTAQARPTARAWLLETVSSDGAWIRQLLVECPQRATRRRFAELLLVCAAGDRSEPTLQVSLASLNDSPHAKTAALAMYGGHVDAVPANRGAWLLDALATIVDLRSTFEFFDLMRRILALSHGFASYLAHRGFTLHLVDLYLRGACVPRRVFAAKAAGGEMSGTGGGYRRTMRRTLHASPAMRASAPDARVWPSPLASLVLSLAAVPGADSKGLPERFVDAALRRRDIDVAVAAAGLVWPDPATLVARVVARVRAYTALPTAPSSGIMFELELTFACEVACRYGNADILVYAFVDLIELAIAQPMEGPISNLVVATLVARALGTVVCRNPEGSRAFQDVKKKVLTWPKLMKKAESLRLDGR